jgi:hypothetical protein
MPVCMFATESFQRLIGVRAAVENQYSGFVWKPRRLKQIEREDAHAMALKAADPFIRPPIYFFHCMGQEGLFGYINRPFEHNIFFGHEGIADILRLASLEAVRLHKSSVRAQYLFGHEGIADILRLASLEAEHRGVANIRALA